MARTSGEGGGGSAPRGYRPVVRTVPKPIQPKPQPVFKPLANLNPRQVNDVRGNPSINNTGFHTKGPYSTMRSRGGW